jgi:transcriptional regulator with XRE-family HTH domain
MARKSDIVEKFGRRVRELRMAQGLSQEDLAELCDLDRTYVNGIERGKRNVGLKNIGAIALALKVSLPHVFEGIVLTEAPGDLAGIPPPPRRKFSGP